MRRLLLSVCCVLLCVGLVAEGAVAKPKAKPCKAKKKAPTCLVVSDELVPGGFGRITGSGLLPNSLVTVTYTYVDPPGSPRDTFCQVNICVELQVDESGKLDTAGFLSFSCGVEIADITATGVTARGETITSNVVASPCG